MYAMQIAKHLIVLLGGMEMAYEFFKLHPNIEGKMIGHIHDVQQKLGDKYSPAEIAEHFFNVHCQPLIESDREQAKVEFNRHLWR